ncbi:MAG TPA: hypothetical protein VF474_14915 [Phenylobacterium sp.]
MAKLGLVDWPADRVVALSGRAASLRLPVTVRNDSVEPGHLAEVAFAEVRLEGKGDPIRLEAAPVGVNLAANQTARLQVRLRLDPATPPGHYRGEVRLGEMTRPVEIDVLADAELAIRPQPAVIDAAAGATQTVAVAFENRGNVPLTIDLAGGYPLGEEDPIAPDRLEGPEGGEALERVLGALFTRRRAPTLKAAGEVTLGMPSGPLHLEPGASRTSAVSVTLPDKLPATARHHVFVPLYDTDLHLVIVTAAKSRPPGKGGTRKQGAAA